SEPLSGNLVLRITPHTSLKLRGRTAEFPRLDFNQQATCLTRHTVTSSDVINFVGLVKNVNTVKIVWIVNA
ncbi:MAG: hypothetical protein MUP27_16140, partial [Desulfobacterales bacterium]|nr:hypothetical protein [Desulfobacterales bacterium]